MYEAATLESKTVFACSMKSDASSEHNTYNRLGHYAFHFRRHFDAVYDLSDSEKKTYRSIGGLMSNINSL